MDGFGSVQMEVSSQPRRFQEISTAITDDYRYVGLTCKYRHALPPGFILKSQKKKEEEDAKKVVITLEEFLDVEVSSRRSGRIECSTDMNAVATQTGPIEIDTAHARIICEMEEGQSLAFPLQ